MKKNKDNGIVDSTLVDTDSVDLEPTLYGDCQFNTTSDNVSLLL